MMLSIWSTVLLFWSLVSAYHLSFPHSVLILPFMGVGCLPALVLRILRCYLQYLRSSHFNIQVFVYHGKWSSNSPPKCPSECLPRITHVPENGFSLDTCILQLPVSLWGLRARHLQVLPDLCPVLCSAAGMGEPDSMIFPVGRITSEFGHCWKESSIVWHVNHDATCLTSLNINLPGNSSQESSHFTNVISNILCTTKYLRQKKKKKAWFYRNTL